MQGASATAAEAPGVAVPTRLFRCPVCERVALEAVPEGEVVARCRACRFETTDLLTLVPVRVVGTTEVLFGRGGRVVLRIGGFLAALGVAVYLLVSSPAP